MREPEAEEHFDAHFNMKTLPESTSAMNAVEERLVSLRGEASTLAREWLLKRGLFNGELTAEVTHKDGQDVGVRVTLTDYGLLDVRQSLDLHEVASVLVMLDELAELWGDEGKFRACRDRLRKLIPKPE